MRTMSACCLTVYAKSPGLDMRSKMRVTGWDEGENIGGLWRGVQKGDGLHKWRLMIDDCQFGGGSIAPFLQGSCRAALGMTAGGGQGFFDLRLACARAALRMTMGC